MKIPNIIPQVIVLLFYITAIFFDAPVTMILENTACAAAVMALMLVFFAKGCIGGGGAKLIASLSIWLGFTEALGQFLAINAAILILSVPALIILRHLLKKDLSTGVPVLPVALLVFLIVFPNGDLFSHISPRFETMFPSFRSQDTASQPPLPTAGDAPFRSKIVPGFDDVEASNTHHTKSPARNEDGQ